MPIVFDEVQGTVTSGPAPEETRRPEAPPPPPMPEPEWVARTIRLLPQRKARLLAD